VLYAIEQKPTENYLDNISIPHLMDSTNTSNVNVTLLEKIIINWALPSDFVYHAIKSRIFQDEYSGQTLKERLTSIWNGKIAHYHRLLEAKRTYGEITQDEVQKCKKTPCAYTRLLLTYFR